MKWNVEIFQWSSETDVESLRWSQKLIEEKFKSTLRDALGEVYSKLPTKYRGRATFKLNMKTIVTTTEETVHNMQELLKQRF